MKLFDFCFFILYKTYERGNSTTSGAFLISSLWFSLLQFFWLFIIVSPVEIYTGIDLFPGLENFYFFAIYVIVIVGLNSIYLNFRNRKNLILTRFNFSKKQQINYLIVLVFVFFCSIFLSIYLASIKY